MKYFLEFVCKLNNLLLDYYVYMEERPMVSPDRNIQRTKGPIFATATDSGDMLAGMMIVDILL